MAWSPCDHQPPTNIRLHQASVHHSTIRPSLHLPLCTLLHCLPAYPLRSPGSAPSLGPSCLRKLGTNLADSPGRRGRLAACAVALTVASRPKAMSHDSWAMRSSRHDVQVLPGSRRVTSVCLANSQHATYINSFRGTAHSARLAADHYPRHGTARLNACRDSCNNNNWLPLPEAWAHMTGMSAESWRRAGTKPGCRLQRWL